MQFLAFTNPFFDFLDMFLLHSFANREVNKWRVLLYPFTIVVHLYCNMLHRISSTRKAYKRRVGMKKVCFFFSFWKKYPFNNPTETSDSLTQRLFCFHVSSHFFYLKIKNVSIFPTLVLFFRLRSADCNKNPSVSQIFCRSLFIWSEASFGIKTEESFC